jgi:4-hydroxy-tetrahydrodipicolinate reductase
VSHAIVVNGAAGRMGRLVAAELLAAGLGDVVGCDPAAGETALLESPRLPLVADLEGAVGPESVIVDFSHPAATPVLVHAACRHGARLVIGTTGQSDPQLEALRDAARQVPIVLARNFSTGINRILELLPQLRVLIQDGFDVECLEAHHRGKRDAPSGTAAALLDALLGPESAATRVHGRLGREARRQPGEVGVHSLRLGALVGEHALLFASDHEVVEIRHRALDRAAFVSGVVPAVRFVRNCRPGLFSMLDVMRHAQAGGS